ncbi:MAG: aminoacyl-tRNA hydrolase [Flavobacteriales bacterium]
MKFLIIGLGNIGKEYEGTRHNIGFSVLDHLCAKEQITFKTDRLADVAQWKYKGRSLVLIKPSTYMNLSGKAVNYWMQQEKIAIENVLVVTDDIALPFGTIRLRAKGSDGGHNGLKSINEVLKTTDYARLRFGVGNDFPKGRQAEYVLSQWSAEQFAALPERLEKCKALIESFVTIGVARTMSLFNNQ